MGAWSKVKGEVRNAWAFYEPSKMGEIVESTVVAVPAKVVTWPLMFALSVATRLVCVASIVASLVVMLVVCPLGGPFILPRMQRALTRERDLASERLRKYQVSLESLDVMSTKLARAKNLLRESETVLRRPDWTGHRSQLDLRMKRFLEE